MTKHNKFLDDVSKIASSTIATLVNIKNELIQMCNEKMKSSAKGMNLTSKSDFNNLKQSVSHLYEEVQKMATDSGTHYNKKGDKMAIAKKPAAKKAAPKKTAVKKTATKKVAAKKTTAKKTVAKKPAAKKAAPKKK